MDPNFVQHALTDIAVRFFGYLIFILAFSTAIHGGMRAVIPDRWENSWYDEAVIYTVGVVIALMIDMNLFFYVGGLTNTQYTLSLPARRADGSPSAWFAPWLVIFTCNIITGALIGAGKKVIVGIGEEFTSGWEAIKRMLGRGNGQGPAVVG